MFHEREYLTNLIADGRGTDEDARIVARIDSYARDIAAIADRLSREVRNRAEACVR